MDLAVFYLCSFCCPTMPYLESMRLKVEGRRTLYIAEYYIRYGYIVECMYDKVV